MVNLVPGLTDPSLPLNPNGMGHCPKCGAHAPMAQKVCQAPDCERVSTIVTDPRYTCKGNGWVRVNGTDREKCTGCTDCHRKGK